jgi:hypothetical protein
VEQRLPSRLSPWLVRVVADIAAENDILRRDGACLQAEVRESLLRQVILAENQHASEKLTVRQASETSGLCEETIRRAIRRGTLQAERRSPQGKSRIEREALSGLTHATQKQVASRAHQYSLDDDAVAIACRRVLHGK